MPVTPLQWPPLGPATLLGQPWASAAGQADEHGLARPVPAAAPRHRPVISSRRQRTQPLSIPAAVGATDRSSAAGGAQAHSAGVQAARVWARLPPGAPAAIQALLRVLLILRTRGQAPGAPAFAGFRHCRRGLADAACMQPPPPPSPAACSPHSLHRPQAAHTRQESGPLKKSLCTTCGEAGLALPSTRPPALPGHPDSPRRSTHLCPPLASVPTSPPPPRAAPGPARAPRMPQGAR